MLFQSTNVVASTVLRSQVLPLDILVYFMTPVDVSCPRKKEEMFRKLVCSSSQGEIPKGIVAVSGSELLVPEGCQTGKYCFESWNHIDFVVATVVIQCMQDLVKLSVYVC